MTLLKQVWPHEGSAPMAVITELALEDVWDVAVVPDILLVGIAVEDWGVVELWVDVVKELALETLVTTLQFPH